VETKGERKGPKNPESLLPPRYALPSIFALALDDLYCLHIYFHSRRWPREARAKAFDRILNATANTGNSLFFFFLV
jgi:hypothetical protein